MNKRSVREYRRGNQQWTIQRNWQHRVHKTMKNKTKTIQRNWQHRVHKMVKNKTKTIQRNWQHRVHKTMKNKTKTIQRNWQHRVHKTMKNKTKTQHNICKQTQITLMLFQKRVACTKFDIYVSTIITWSTPRL